MYKVWEDPALSLSEAVGLKKGGAAGASEAPMPSGLNAWHLELWPPRDGFHNAVNSNANMIPDFSQVKGLWSKKVGTKWVQPAAWQTWSSSGLCLLVGESMNISNHKEPSEWTGYELWNHESINPSMSLYHLHRLHCRLQRRKRSFEVKTSARLQQLRHPNKAYII